jgi:hypothetical protein
MVTDPSSSMPLRYRITELFPLVSAGSERCEEHYVRHHVPMIVQARRSDPEPRVLRYRPHRAVAELTDGRWGPSECYWRFVFATYVNNGTLGAHNTRHISDDHVNWVQDMRSFEVDSSTLLDRRSGQLSSVKYLVLGSGGDELVATLPSWRAQLGALARRAFGIRLVIANDAIAEQETEPINLPGQRFTRRVLPMSGYRYYDEVYLDSELAGSEFFGQPELVAALPAAARVLRVDEVNAFDPS